MPTLIFIYKCRNWIKERLRNLPNIAWPVTKASGFQPLWFLIAGYLYKDYSVLETVFPSPCPVLCFLPKRKRGLRRIQWSRRTESCAIITYFFHLLNVLSASCIRGNHTFCQGQQSGKKCVAPISISSFSFWHASTLSSLILYPQWGIDSQAIFNFGGNYSFPHK